MTNVYKNIISKELENVPNQYLAEILSYIHLIKNEMAENSDENVPTQTDAFFTTHPALPDYIVIDNHLN